MLKYLLTLLCIWQSIYRLSTIVVTADEDNHRYLSSPPEPVVVWISSVSPYHNPSEQYTLYNDLPVCRPDRLTDTPIQRPPHLGELVLGSALENSDIPIQFRTSVDKVPLCTMTINEEEAQLFAYAISNHYLVAYLIDDLPVYAMLGEIVLDEAAVENLESHVDTPHGIAENTFLYTHKTFSLAYNDDQIVAVNLSATNPVRIEANKKYELTYSVNWVPSNDDFNARFDRYMDNDMRRTQVRWFGVINSALMAVFLCGAVALILLRTLRADFARYLRDEEEEGLVEKSSLGDETGWKQVSWDIFRRPSSVVLYSALVGVGSHLFLLSMLVILASLISSLHVDRGAVVKAGVVGYALTSAASGFFSGAFYRGLYPDEVAPNWQRVMLLSAILFPGLCVGLAVLLSFVALSYGTNSYISLWTLIKLSLLWLIISVPLTIGGTIMGRRFSKITTTAPFRVNHVPRPVPCRPWYFSSTVMCLAAGFLPFGSVFVEIYYIATSAWGHAIYAAWALFLVVLLILSMVVSCVSIVSVYLLLNAEDHRWHWHSFFSGASVSIYVFLYSIYFYIFRTEMSGLLQAAFYFGYSALACIAVALMTGTIGTLSSSIFIRAIYSSIKAD